MLFTYFIFTLISLLFINMYQFARRKIIQLILITLLTLFIIYKCIFQNMSYYRVLNPYLIILILVVCVTGMNHRHNFSVLAFRSLQVLIYLIIIMIVIILNLGIKENGNFYSSMLFQYSTFLIKKVNCIYIQYRIQSNLQYDDVSIFQIGTVTLEYMFIFDFILIQDNGYV